MVRKVIPVLLISALVFSAPLFTTTVGKWNPIEAAFLHRYISVQFDYISDDHQRVALSGGISSDLLNAYAVALTDGNFLSGTINLESMKLDAAAIADLKLANTIVIGGTICGTFSLNEGFKLRDGAIPIVAGLGGKSESPMKISAGSIYYFVGDLVRIESGRVEVNDGFDYTNGYVGVYGVSHGINGSSYVNMGFSLRLVKVIEESGESIDAVDLLKRYAFFSLTHSSEVWTLGGTWKGNPDGVYYYDLFLGLDLEFLKIWATTYAQPPSGVEIFKRFYFSAQISL